MSTKLFSKPLWSISFKRMISLSFILISLVLPTLAQADIEYRINDLKYTIPYGYEPLKSSSENNDNIQIRVYVNNEDQSLLTLIYQSYFNDNKDNSNNSNNTNNLNNLNNPKIIIDQLRNNYDQAVPKVKQFIYDWASQLHITNININQVYRYKINSKTPGVIAIGNGQLPQIGKVFLTIGYVYTSNYSLSVITYDFTPNAETVGNVLDSLNDNGLITY